MNICCGYLLESPCLGKYPKHWIQFGKLSLNKYHYSFLPTSRSRQANLRSTKLQILREINFSSLSDCNIFFLTTFRIPISEPHGVCVQKVTLGIRTFFFFFRLFLESFQDGSLSFVYNACPFAICQLFKQSYLCGLQSDLHQILSVTGLWWGIDHIGITGKCLQNCSCL